MIILIDFYNFFYSRFCDLNEFNVCKLINEINFYSQKKKKKINIVFDGFFCERFVKNSNNSKNFIIFSYPSSADDFIIEEIDKYSKGSLIVVSSDKQIYLHAKKNLNKTFSSKEFYDEINVEKMISSFENSKKINKASKIKKTCSGNDDMLYELMKKWS
jgi:predicted RNA-binding protein with PIN domain